MDPTLSPLIWVDFQEKIYKEGALLRASREAMATAPACLVLDEPTSALDEAQKLLKPCLLDVVHPVVVGKPTWQ